MTARLAVRSRGEPAPRGSAAFYDPRSGDQALRLTPLESGRQPHQPARTNYFSIYWIQSGRGTFWADAAQHAFAPNSLLFFVPYQYIYIVPESMLSGHIVHFHANFLCVETFHAEVGCAGILFNDHYGTPAVTLDKHTREEVAWLVGRIEREQQGEALARGELMLAYLKALLVLATRLKTGATGCVASSLDTRQPVLAELRELIEANYRTLHSASEYAARLHITPKTLGRIVREQLGTTPTELIRARILTHAKWELLHTLRPVKEIARELGFDDELYFSRLFKKATGCSPTFFREFETEIRGGSNLSMLSGKTSILSGAPGGR